MKISEVLATVNLDGGIFIGDMVLVLAAAMTLIQISPIKIDPWSWLARKIGRAVNGELFEKIGELDKSLVNIKKTIERRDAIDARNRILRFGDECLHEQRHTKEHFDEILRDIKHYNDYCTAHQEFDNGVTSLTAQRIEELYHDCLANDEFL